MKVTALLSCSKVIHTDISTNTAHLNFSLPTLVNWQLIETVCVRLYFQLVMILTANLLKHTKTWLKCWRQYPGPLFLQAY